MCSLCECFYQRIDFNARSKNVTIDAETVKIQLEKEVRNKSIED